MATFISDLHLGTGRTKVDKILKFLHSRDVSDPLYLVGDIFDYLALDTWKGKDRPVVHRIMEFKTIVYLPGNHDEMLFNLTPFDERGITIQRWVLYKGLLVIHGHQFDPSYGFGRTRFIPRNIMRLLSRMSDPTHHGPLGAIVRRKAQAFCEVEGYLGVIMGHTHRPCQPKDRATFQYWNTGDWVTHCTALIDDGDGLRLVKYR